MSRINLPLGKKPLPVIQRVADPVDRIEDFAKLLEWLLVIHVPGADEAEGLGYLGEHVQRHADKFSNIRFVNAAIGIYNDIKHAKPVKDRPPPTKVQIEGAAKNLEQAVLEILPYVPEPVRRAVVGDAWITRFWRSTRPAAGVLAGLVLFGIAVTSIISGNSTRTSTEVDRRSNARPEQDQPRRADNLAAASLGAVDDLERAAVNWDSATTSLMTNDAGRKLASSTDAVRDFLALRAGPWPAVAQVKGRRQEAMRLAEAARAGKSEFAPTHPVFVQLETLFRRSREERRACVDALEQLDRLIERHRSALPSKKTLGEAIDDLNAAEAIARRVAERKVADERERKRVESAKAAEERKRALDVRYAAARAEYQRLQALAADPEIQKQFAPFLERGTRVPFRDYEGVRWRNEFGRKAGQPTPMHFSWLQQARVLNSVDDMVAVGCDAGNDRPKWIAPTTAADWQKFGERFELLKQLAPVWHDKGLLGPRPGTPHLQNPDDDYEMEQKLEGK